MLWIWDPKGYISLLHLWIIRQHRFITRPLVFYGKRNNLWINVCEWVGTSLPCLEHSSLCKLHVDHVDRKYQKSTYPEMTTVTFCLVFNKLSALWQNAKKSNSFSADEANLKMQLLTSGGSNKIWPRGGPPVPSASSQSNVFQFHAVFGKNGQINRIASPPWGLAPPLGNSASATVSL